MDFSGVIENVYENQGKVYMVTRLDKNLLTEKEIEDAKQKRTKIKILKDGQGRTLQQNALMWKIISDIDEGVNGIPTEDGRREIYTMGIEQLGVEYEDFLILSHAVDFFKKNFRRCRIIDYIDDRVLLRCFTGSSKFNKKQMGELIDWFIRFAARLEIPILDYQDEWEVLFGQAVS